MKKLFTLFAFMAVVLGAKAEWVQDYKIEYQSLSNFPFYVMGYVPEWVEGVMTDYGSDYRYATQDVLDKGSDDKGTGKLDDAESVIGSVMAGTTEYQKVTGKQPYWHQYFVANEIPTEIGGTYTLKAMAKASAACTIDMTMQWGWGSGQSLTSKMSIGTEWAEVECEFAEVGATNCSVVAKPGESTATIEWKYIIVGHNAKAQAPTNWRNILSVNENGEPTGTTFFPVQTLFKSTEDDNNDIPADEIYAKVKPCAWSKDGNSIVYTYTSTGVDKTAYTRDANAYQWANQLFIVAAEEDDMKDGDIVRVSFKYKADAAAAADTQAHGLPSYYHHWQFMGEVSFGTEWTEYSKQITISSDMVKRGGNAEPMYSVAFNLNKTNQDANTFYLKDVKIEKMVLENGYFVAGCNAKTGLEYDFANAVKFEEDEEGLLVATVGAGGENSWVKEVMISTVRGNDAAFKGKTIKLDADVTNDETLWPNFVSGSLSKITLPQAGVWTISIAPEDNQINFVMTDGEERATEIKANPTEIVVNGKEREYKKDEAPEGYEFQKNDKEEDIVGADWDNQLCIMSNYVLKTGDETIIEFDYVAEKEATVGTQLGGSAPGQYVFWNCLGDLTFTTKEQHFRKEYKIPMGHDYSNDTDVEISNAQSITFNMALLKDANKYTVKNVIWKLADNSKSLIDQEGTKNFFVKEGAGTTAREFGTETAIQTVAKNNVSSSIYNIAGQRVSNNYKGIVVKNGAKYVRK